MSVKQFDLIVIGAGPGGYVAAIRGAQLGLSVAIVEKRSSLGGTCLNVGCIPSKALLDSSELYYQAAEHFDVHGIGVKDLKLDFKKMMSRKQDVVHTTTLGIDYLMKKNKIERYEGLGSFQDASTVQIQGKDSTETIKGSHIIIATGSDVAELPALPFDHKRIISSDDALELKKVPKKMIVVGGGVIGVELGSVYARLGCEVTVVEFMDRLIPTMDKELGKHLERSLKKIGFKFHFKTKVTGAKTSSKGVKVSAENAKGEAITLDTDAVLVAIGRRPYTDGLNLEAAGLKTDDRGRIEINDRFQTSVPTIYAIGDIVQGPMLAHKASEEGVACVEGIAGLHPHYHPDTVPGVVYTWPEVASVGRSEEVLKNEGIAYKSGKFPFKASGRARAAEESEGFIKVLSDANTDEILGIHMIGPRCADLIAEAVVAMEYRASAEDIGRIIHPHPTYSESLKEAALMAWDKNPIHI